MSLLGSFWKGSRQLERDPGEIQRAAKEIYRAAFGEEWPLGWTMLASDPWQALMILSSSFFEIMQLLQACDFSLEHLHGFTDYTVQEVYVNPQAVLASFDATYWGHTASCMLWTFLHECLHMRDYIEHGAITKAHGLEFDQEVRRALDRLWDAVDA